MRNSNENVKKGAFAAPNVIAIKFKREELEMA